MNQMKYNAIDGINYGTLAQRDASTELVKTGGTKAYVYGTATVPGILYIANGTIWTLA